MCDPQNEEIISYNTFLQEEFFGVGWHLRDRFNYFYKAYGNSHLITEFCAAETVVKLRSMATFLSQSNTSCITVHSYVYVYGH